jgi:hypothetical protein
VADDVLTDPRADAPECTQKGCGAQAGDPWCYSGPGRFRRHWHAVRVAAAKGHAAPPAKKAGSLAGRLPTDKQAHIIAVAAATESGPYEVSGYGFHGEAQTRRAMDAMTDPARGWFEHVRETQHGTLFKLTGAGRAINTRYENWMNGAPW